jgi:hypothetical protein
VVGVCVGVVVCCLCGRFSLFWAACPWVYRFWGLGVGGQGSELGASSGLQLSCSKLLLLPGSSTLRSS